MLTTLVTFIIVLGILIFVHEFGHYIVAKMTGVRVEEFALGFGPRLVGFEKGETQYSIRAFPLGGFCKMTGEFPHAEEDLEGEELEIYNETIKEGRALFQKSVLERFGVIFTGPVMNFLLAVILFTIIFSIAGVPASPSNAPIIGDLVPNRPAADAGLKIGDEIVSIEDQPVNNWDDITGILNQVEDDQVKVIVEREGEQKEFNLTPASEENTDRKVIGIFPKVVNKQVGFGTAIWRAIQQTWLLMKAIVVGFWQMLTFQIKAEVGGPVTIARMIGQAAEVGWVYLLRFTALISVNLGIINLIPFPALDGGRILFLIIEVIRGEAVDPEKEGIVHFIGFVVLMILMAFIIYKDIAAL